MGGEWGEQEGLILYHSTRLVPLARAGCWGPKEQDRGSCQSYEAAPRWAEFEVPVGHVHGNIQKAVGGMAMVSWRGLGSVALRKPGDMGHGA